MLLARYVNRENDRIFLIASNTALDTVNNMHWGKAAPVNSRNPAVTVKRQSNGIHPATSGYRQIGDALWAFLKCQYDKP